MLATHIVTSLNALPAEMSLCLIFITSVAGLLGFSYFFGKSGLYVYTALAIVLGNLQVLKGTQLSLLDNPVALGTILFSSTFVVSDALTECYGASIAKRAVGLGFGASLLASILMLLTLGVPPLTCALTHPDGHFVQAHQAMEVLFLPAPAILTASLIAFLASQLLDIALFQRLKARAQTSSLWGRAGFSTAVAFLLDNAIFSTLAWVVFSPTPISWQSLLFTYILGTYAIRLLCTVAFIPVLYGVCHFLKKRSHVH